MRITVLGTGYVGLVAGACFSDSGNHVYCVDIDQKKIESLQKGQIPIFEPGLDELVIRNAQAKRLVFTTDAERAIGESQVVFVAVGTPSTEDGSLDLTYTYKALETIREAVREETIVVLKSTVPVGTARRAKEILQSARKPVAVVSNPEFLKEGTAVSDFLKPERVVIGTDSDKARRIMEDLYSPYIRSGNPILFMSNESAELAKYTANAFLAMKISFINDMAQLCEATGAAIHDVRKALVTDSRIGNKFLYPGCGYGGSCFPKDVLALRALGVSSGLPLEIISAVDSINRRQKRVIFQKIQRHFRGDLKNKTIAVWGLAFKPMTDDMREAPSVTLIQLLLEEGARIRAYDPVAKKEAKRIFENQIELFDDAYEAIRSADALAIMTEWNEFRTPDFKSLKAYLKSPTIFDGRNIYNPQSMAEEKINYYCIGRPDPV